MSFFKKKPVIIIVTGAILTVSLFYIFNQNSQTDINTPTGDSLENTNQLSQQNSDLQAMEDVNPEEKNELLKRLRLPYENDRLAITHKPNPDSAYGITLVIIDKTRPNGPSNDVREEANNYLSEYGIRSSNSGIPIKYIGLNDAR